MRMHSEKTLKNKSNNNDEFLCANIHEGQAQWRDKTKGLRIIIIVNNTTQMLTQVATESVTYICP